MKIAAPKTKSGPKPDINILTVAHLSESALNAAPVAMSGANAHSPHVTKFGLDFPRTMSRIYANAPLKLITTESKTNQCAYDKPNKALSVNNVNIKQV